MNSQRKQMLQESIDYLKHDARTPSMANAFSELMDDYEKLQASITEMEKDAARWKEVAFGSNPFLGVFYVDSFGNERMLCEQDAIDVVDGSIKIYMQKD